LTTIHLMNNTEETPENSTCRKLSRFSPCSAICGLILGLGLAGSFYAGHELCPQNAVKSPDAGGNAAVLPGALPLAKGLTGNNAGNFIADIVATASPSVVNIDTSTSMTVPGIYFPHFGFGDPIGGGGNFLRSPTQKFESHGAGSGVIIREDGYIITNNHVVQNADDIKVTLSDGRSFKGKVVGKDKFTDVALVKIPASGLKAAKIGVSKNLRPGDWAIAIGSPLGFSQSVTLGIVSALGRSLGDINAGVDLIQTDAAINPGNSGGPLLNIKGEVIGINQAISARGQNISFAIPIDVAKPVADQLMLNGTIHHPFLGIHMADMDEKVAKALKLPSGTKGVAIGAVQSGSPAHKAGLLPGDVIQRLNGVEVNSAREIQKIVREHKPGEKLDMTVLRQQMVVMIPVKIGDYDDLKPRKQAMLQPGEQEPPDEGEGDEQEDQDR
jgi:serine protease Do